MAMVEVKCEVKCPVCESNSVSKHGKTPKGVRRYICNNNDCPRKIFTLEYIRNGNKPGIDERIVKMTANASGIRDISRVLEISADKVISTLKKRKQS
jgi:transposase-like protein